MQINIYVSKENQYARDSYIPLQFIRRAQNAIDELTCISGRDS